MGRAAPVDLAETVGSEGTSAWREWGDNSRRNRLGVCNFQVVYSVKKKKNGAKKYSGWREKYFLWKNWREKNWVEGKKKIVGKLEGVRRIKRMMIQTLPSTT